MLAERIERIFDQGKAAIDRYSNYALLKRKFKRSLGYPLDLEHPETFNEKVQWRKINVRNPVYIRASDKLGMPEYVRALIGPEHCNDLFTNVYAHTDNAATFDFDALPAQFMLKPTHGSGWIHPVRANDVRNNKELRKICKRWLSRRFGRRNHEWGYLGIKPRVLAEELLLTEGGHLASDVKIHVSDGEIRHAFCVIDRYGKDIHLHVTSDWEKIHKADPDPSQSPVFGWEKMKDIALRIGQNFDYVRVDFLSTETRFVLNELTFYPGSGLNQFYNDQAVNQAFDTQLGKTWTPTPDGFAADRLPVTPR